MHAFDIVIVIRRLFYLSRFHWDIFVLKNCHENFVFFSFYRFFSFKFSSPITLFFVFVLWTSYRIYDTKWMWFGWQTRCFVTMSVELYFSLRFYGVASVQIHTVWKGKFHIQTKKKVRMKTEKMDACFELLLIKCYYTLESNKCPGSDVTENCIHKMKTSGRNIKKKSSYKRTQLCSCTWDSYDSRFHFSHQRENDDEKRRFFLVHCHRWNIILSRNISGESTRHSKIAHEDASMH